MTLDKVHNTYIDFRCIYFRKIAHRNFSSSYVRLKRRKHVAKRANGILAYEYRGKKKKQNKSNFAESGLDPIVFVDRASVDPAACPVVERA